SLDDLLDIHAPHTYLVRVSGDSMIGAGIYDCDILVVSRAREARHRDIVVAALNGDMLVKRIWLREQTILMPENPAYAPRYILEGDELQVWGIVTHSIRSHTIGEPKPFIKMGDPYFMIKSLIRQHKIEVFSSNYALYGDMSDRVMTLLEQRFPA